MFLRSLPLVVALVGCTGEGPQIEYIREVQIDGAVEGADPQSGSSRMCATPSGKTYAVWTDDRSGKVDVWMNVLAEPKGAWLEQPVKVNQGAGNAAFPDIACTDDRVYIVWEDDRDSETKYPNVYFNSSADDGATWQEDKMLDDDVGGHNISQKPRITAWADRVYVTWFDNRNGANDIFVVGSNNRGRDFFPPLRVDGPEEPEEEEEELPDAPGQSHSQWPKITHNNAGRVYIVWEDARNMSAEENRFGTDIFATASLGDGQEFTPATRLDGGDEKGKNYSFAPELAADGDNVYVVWHDDRDGDGRTVYYNYSADGGYTWLEAAAPAEVDVRGLNDSLFPVVAAIGNKAHIAWQDARNVGFDIYYREVVAGVAQGEEDERIERDAKGFANSLNPRVTLGAEGQVLIGWEDDRNDAGEEGYNDLYYAWREADDDWEGNTDLRLDSIAEGTAWSANLGFALIGDQVVSAWTTGRGGTGDIYASRVTLGKSVGSEPLP